MKQLATVADYSDLIDVLRRRCDELQVSRAELDEAAELTPGYSSKLLAPVPTSPKLGAKRNAWRMLSVQSFGSVLQALGLCLVVCVDPVADRSAATLEHRRYPYLGNKRLANRPAQPVSESPALPAPVQPAD